MGPQARGVSGVTRGGGGGDIYRARGLWEYVQGFQIYGGCRPMDHIYISVHICVYIYILTGVPLPTYLYVYTDIYTSMDWAPPSRSRLLSPPPVPPSVRIDL
jgi:hypothetical protein